MNDGHGNAAEDFPFLKGKSRPYALMLCKIMALVSARPKISMGQFCKKLLLFMAFAGVCVPAVAASPKTSTEVAIKAENARWANAFQRGDYRAIGQFYTEDGTLLPPGGERIHGRAAIAEYFIKGYAGKAPDTVTFSDFEFYGNDDV